MHTLKVKKPGNSNSRQAAVTWATWLEVRLKARINHSTEETERKREMRGRGNAEGRTKEQTSHSTINSPVSATERMFLNKTRN